MGYFAWTVDSSRDAPRPPLKFQSGDRIAIFPDACPPPVERAANFGYKGHPGER